MKTLIYSALAVAAIALAGCTDNKKAETTNENTPAPGSEQPASAPEQYDAYEVDVEATEIDTVKTPEGVAVDVENEVTLTPEEVPQ